MMGDIHWFWLALMAAVLIWYSTITIYISVRGAIDIKEMLGRLDQRAKEEEKRP